jgi:hypothetical protein
MPTYQSLGPDDRDGLEDRWKPSIQHDQEQAIPIRELDATAHPSLQHNLASSRLFDLNGEANRVRNRPELRMSDAAAQTRIVSVIGIRLNSRESMRSFKGIICDDVSEFESYHPSQAVRSLGGCVALAKFVRHSHELWNARQLLDDVLKKVGCVSTTGRALC